MAVVSGIVNYDGKILIGKKNSNSKKFLAGCWHIPGETIKGEESDVIALKRGFREEANLEIIVGNYLDFSITPSSKSEVRWYECFSQTNEVKYGSDLEDIKWVLKKDVLKCCDKKVTDLWSKKIKDYFS